MPNYNLIQSTRRYHDELETHQQSVYQSIEV